jgi:hypothetical protein
MHPFNWFDINWPWIGLAGSAALWVLLLGTNVFCVSAWNIDPSSGVNGVQF